MSSDSRISSPNPETSTSDKSKLNEEKANTNWFIVLFYIYLHLAAFYGIILIFREAKLATTILSIVICFIAPYGMTIGAHRLWAHKSYEATLSLRIILCILQTFNAQGSIYNWVRLHRLHHKYRGTPSDPIKHSRGFSYAHINYRFKDWTSTQEKLFDKIDMSDLEKDSVVMFQKKLYWILMPIISFLLPINAPVEYWGESIVTSLCIVGLLRHVILFHLASLINSGSLLWASKENEREADSNMIFFIQKSYWPEYHYLLPWDYRTNEFGSYNDDKATSIINFLEKQGFIKNLKSCSEVDIIRAMELSMDLKLPFPDSIQQILNENKQK